MNVVIFLNGNLENYDFVKSFIKDEDYILGVDGGLNHIHNMKIKPNYILGDFDSVKLELLDLYKEVPTESFPTHKDFTDSELAINFALKLDCLEILVFGGIGTRMDHTLTNIHLMLKVLLNGKIMKIIDYNNIIQLRNKSFTISDCGFKNISLIPISEVVENVKTCNLSYPLYCENLYLHESYGVSNEILENCKEFTVNFDSGILCIIFSRD